MANGKYVILSGGAQAKNIFWQVAGGAGVVIGTTAKYEREFTELKLRYLMNTGAFIEW